MPSYFPTIYSKVGETSQKTLKCEPYDNVKEKKQITRKNMRIHPQETMNVCSIWW